MTNTQVGQLYKAIVQSIQSIVGEDTNIHLIVNTFIYSPGREAEVNSVDVIISKDEAANQIPRIILDAILDYSDVRGWPMNRADIVSPF